MKNKKLIGQLNFIREYECSTKDEKKAIDKAIKIIDEQSSEKEANGNAYRDGLYAGKQYMVSRIRGWLSSFNTDSATECFTAVQKLKEMLNE